MKISLDNNINMTNYDIKEEVYKCSKCGLCQSVCPLFLATKNEMYLSRGRYIVLNGVYNLSNKLSKNFIKNLDVCLNCNACKNFCPSNIDASKVFNHLKNQNKYKYTFCHFSSIYFVILKFLSFARFLYRLLPFKSIFLDSFIDTLFFVKVPRKKQNKNNLTKGKVVYFQGCFNKNINPSDKNATLNLIEKNGYKVLNVISNCCGYPYFNEGNFDGFAKNAKKILSSLNSDYDFIVCSCDSCYETLAKIPNYIEGAEDFSKKLIRIDEFLKLNNFKLNASPLSLYFKPLLRINECYLPANSAEIKKKGLCSLMENFFFIKYPQIAKQVLETVFYRKEEIQDKTIITSCLLSKLGIMVGSRLIKSNARVLSYSEFIEINDGLNQ